MDGGSKETAEVPWKETRAVDERLRFIAAVQHYSPAYASNLLPRRVPYTIAYGKLPIRVDW